MKTPRLVPYFVLIFTALVLSPGILGCAGGASEADNAAKARLANDLVQCQNERSGFKEQLAAAQAEIKKLKEAADTTVHLDPMELRAGGDPSKGPRRVEGNLPPDQVIKVFKANQGGLRACYERGLKRNPNLQFVNTVNVRFDVKNTGNAGNIGFAPHADAEMEKCMSTTIEKWRFPSFVGDPVKFDYPVSLVAKGP